MVIQKRLDPSEESDGSVRLEAFTALSNVFAEDMAEGASLLPVVFRVHLPQSVSSQAMPSGNALSVLHVHILVYVSGVHAIVLT